MSNKGNTAENPDHVKTRITIRIDKDILKAIRGENPRGYQSRINTLLRDHLMGKRKVDLTDELAEKVAEKVLIVLESRKVNPSKLGSSTFSY